MGSTASLTHEGHSEATSGSTVQGGDHRKRDMARTVHGFEAQTDLLSPYRQYLDGGYVPLTPGRPGGALHGQAAPKGRFTFGEQSYGPVAKPSDQHTPVPEANTPGAATIRNTTTPRSLLGSQTVVTDTTYQRDTQATGQALLTQLEVERKKWATIAKNDENAAPEHRQLEASVAQLKALLAKDTPPTQAELLAIASKYPELKTEVATKVTGSTTKTSGSSLGFTGNGLTFGTGEMERKVDANGNKSGTGHRKTASVSLEQGKVATTLKKEQADGSSKQVGGTIDKDGNVAITASDNAADGKFKSGGLLYNKGQKGRDGNVGLQLSGGNVSPIDKEKKGDLKLTSDGVDTNGSMDVWKKAVPPGADGGTYSVTIGGGLKVDVFVTKVSSAPIKYKLTCKFSGYVNIGGGVGYQKTGRGSFNVKGAHKQEFSESWERVYDEAAAAKELGRFEGMKRRNPVYESVAKWKAALAGGRIERVGDAKESMTSVTNSLEGKGSADAGALKFGYEGKTSHKRTNTIRKEMVRPGVIRVTVTFMDDADTAHKLVGGTKGVHGGGHKGETTKDADAWSVDLKKSDPKFAEKVKKLKEAPNRKTLQRLSEAYGPNGWSVTENKTTTHGAVLGADKATVNVGGKEMNIAPSLMTNHKTQNDQTITLKDGEISSTGEGAQSNGIDAKLGEKTWLSSSDKHGGKAASKGDDATLKLETTKERRGLANPVNVIKSANSLTKAAGLADGLDGTIKNLLTKQRKELSGTDYSKADLQTLVGRASRDWGSIAGEIYATPQANVHWMKLGERLRKPWRIDRDKLRRRLIKAYKAGQMTKPEYRKLRGQLYWALRCKALNTFLSETGKAGQGLLRQALTDTDSDGIESRRGKDYFWPAKLAPTKTKFDALQTQVNGLEATLKGGAYRDPKTGQAKGNALLAKASTKLRTVRSEISDAQGLYLSAHQANAYAEVQAKLQGFERKIGQARASLAAHHGGSAVTKDTPALQERQKNLDRLDRLDKKLIAYKASEEIHMSNFEDWSSWYDVRARQSLLAGHVSRMYHQWVAVIREKRTVYDALGIVSARNISARNGKRIKRREPDVERFRKAWDKFWGAGDSKTNPLFKTLETY